jgi:transposase InsO family protein
VTEVYRAVGHIALDGFSISLICKLLSVSRSGYYAFEKDDPSDRDMEDSRLGEIVEDVFHAHRSRYGARRIAKQLRKDDETCSRRRAGKLMKQRGLRAIQPKSFQVKTTQSAHGLGYNENLLLNAPAPTEIDRVWLGDITYIPLKGGRFAFLALLMDLYSRRILAWDIKMNMKEELVLAPLRAAIADRRPGAGLIHHSDRGGQYAGGKYRQLLEQWKISQSMSRADNCYDNAFMESCFGTIKRELEMGVYDDFYQARQEIADYVRYYNYTRIHSSLDYQTPNEFERSSSAK